MPTIYMILCIGLTLLIIFVPYIAIIADEVRFTGQHGDRPTYDREMSSGFPGSWSGSSLTARLKTS